jgi:hypothetical protein
MVILSSQDTTLPTAGPTEASKGVKTSLLRAWTQVDLWIILVAGLLFVTFFLVMANIQFATPDMPDNDGFYHIRFAEVMRQEGFKPNFPWLPLSILNAREYSDHHFLFHVALIPFTFGDLRLGAKWAAVTFAALAFLSVWWLLRRQRVPYSAFWALGMLVISEAFLYRMSITRAQSLSLAFLIIGLHWMMTKQYRWLIPLSFLYVWLYDAFPLMLILAAIYVGSTLLLEKKLEWQPLLYTALGIGLGLLVNPYFPDNIVFFIRHLAPKLTETTTVSVGSEWYPYRTTQLLENSPIALVAFLAGVVALGLSSRRMESKTATALFITILFGLMLFQSRRFVEYFPPFALIFCALAWKPLFQNSSDSRDAAQTEYPASVPVDKRPRYLNTRLFAQAILGLIIVAGGWMTVRDTKLSIATSKPYSLYSGAAQWLSRNTDTGARVFQTDWDDFPRLFFYNTHNTYLIGLDPTYMQLYDADLYALWEKITQGELEHPSDFIYPRFGASYVMSDLIHQDFIRQAENDPGLQEVYRDSEAVVFQVKEPN